MYRKLYAGNYYSLRSFAALECARIGTIRAKGKGEVPVPIIIVEITEESCTLPRREANPPGVPGKYSLWEKVIQCGAIAGKR